MSVARSQVARDPTRGSVLIEMLVVLPLLLLVLGGVVDFSQSLADRAASIEIARTIGRAASRTWVIDEPRMAASAEKALTRYLAAAAYERSKFQMQVRLLDLDLGGNRYTKAVEVTVRPGNRPYHFLPGRFSPTLTGTSFYRLENAHVEIRESESDSY